MKNITGSFLILWFLLSASLVFAEDQVQRTIPPSTAAEQGAPPAQSAPAVPEPPKADPIGANAGGIGDIAGYSASGVSADDMKTLEEVKKTEPFAVKVADSVGKNRIAINIVWTLVCGFLVMFMQAGFAMAETGFTQAKNAGHTMAMNFMVYGLGLLGFWLTGFALQMGGAGPFASLGGGATMNGEFTISLFGKDFGLFGTKGFMLGGEAYDAAIYTMFLFQMVFMDTTATIPTGSMAERWTMKSFIVYALFISGIVYPLYANWVWGGGWLAKLGTNFALGHGHVDFAGSSVVHLTGGMAALAGAIVLGPRIGKFGPDGKPRAIPGHHIPMAVVGCFILAFGWFGFNAGSTLAGSDFRIGVVAVNTMLAGGAAAISSWMYMWIRYGKPDISMSANGMLAGLVAITAPCAFVNSLSAVIIGSIAGVLVCISVFFIERVLKIDDPVGAISVHGVNGAWGVLSLGLFADGVYGDAFNGVPGTVKGLFYGDSGQFIAQLIGTATNMIFVFVVMYVFFKVLNMIVPLRVDPELEVEGLDQAEVAVTAYPDFQTRHSHR
ncbi:MAG: ammonium transporter [Thermodesulfovibrionales bacterium]